MKLHEALALKNQNKDLKVKRAGAVGEATRIDLNDKRAWDDGWCVEKPDGTIVYNVLVSNLLQE